VAGKKGGGRTGGGFLELLVKSKELAGSSHVAKKSHLIKQSVREKFGTPTETLHQNERGPGVNPSCGTLPPD